MKFDSINSPWDWLKWIGVWILIAAMIAANYYYADQAVTWRILWSLLILAVTVILAFFTAKGQQLWNFAKESRAELRKVSWPNRQEILQSTLMIMVVVVITALFLWGIDSVLLWGIRFFTGQRG